MLKIANFSGLGPSATFPFSVFGQVVPVLKINNHATGGWRTKDILGGPKGWGPKKKVANVEIYVIF